MSDTVSTNSSTKTTRSKNGSNNYKAIQWRREHEDILIDWADKAMCYRWMHTKSADKFSTKNTWFTIPVIIISTITGTANFAQENIPVDSRAIASMIIGGFNLFAGILTTIQQFLKITELSEAHRVSIISWDKFNRNIKVELSKHPEERIHSGQMLKICKEEFDRLMETCPSIPEKIAIRFQNEFSNTAGYMEIKKPEICGELVTTEEYRYEGGDEEDDDMDQSVPVENSREDIERVQKFRREFFVLKSREPFVEEVLSNIGDHIQMTKVSIERILNKNTSSNLEIRID